MCSTCIFKLDIDTRFLSGPKERKGEQYQYVLNTKVERRDDDDKKNISIILYLNLLRRV